MSDTVSLETMLQMDERPVGWSSASWYDLVEHVVATLDVGPGTRVWDVTCGAGSFLMPLAENGYIVGGSDGRHELLRVARKTMPQGLFTDAEPWSFDPADPVDVVVASRGFSACRTSDHARGLVARMLAKATHAVAFLGIDEDNAPAGVDRVRLFRMLAELGVTGVHFEHDAEGRLMALVKV
jgi:ubiquinone/menaquinone biosynthesis C-methylase UbiE